MKSQGQIETEIEDLCAHLEALTNGGPSPITGEIMVGYDVVLARAAEAETDWKIAEAKAVVREAAAGITKDRKDLQEKRALIAHEDLFRAYKISQAVAASAKEALTTTRTKIDAKRTQAANVRAQT